MTNTRKLIGSAAFAAALAGGGVAGALLGTPGTSSAQASTTTTTTEDGEGTVVRAEHRGKHLAVAATALGMTVEELRAELRAGHTIAEVAAAQDVDVDSVIDALVAAATEDIRERITARVNGELPEGGHRHRHRHGHGPRPATEETAPSDG